MTGVVDVLWPLGGRTARDNDAEARYAEAEDLREICGSDWNSHFEIALEESRFLSVLEKERRQAAESKAYAYLAGISALLAVVAPLAVDYSEHFGQKSFTFQISSIVLSILSLGYLLGAVWWSSKVLEVSVHHRIDATDYAKIWRQDDIRGYLVSEILSSVRLNREVVNKKVSCIRMAHRFMVRAVFSLSILIGIVLSWDLFSTVFDAIYPADRWRSMICAS